MHVYKMWNGSELLYVGKSTQIVERIRQHNRDKLEINWKNNITKIEIAKCKNKTDMTIYEIYYINKLKPKYNKEFMYGEEFSVEIPDLIFIDYESIDVDVLNISIFSKGIILSLLQLSVDGYLRYNNYRKIKTIKDLWRFIGISQYKVKTFMSEVNLDELITKTNNGLILNL